MTHRFFLSIFLVISAVLIIPRQSLAHHSLPVDSEHLTTIHGVVTEFDMTNPHVMLHVSVMLPDGMTQYWVAETAPPLMLHQVGWDKNTIKPGDRIMVSGFRARDGALLLRVRQIMLSNGQVLNQR